MGVDDVLAVANRQALEPPLTILYAALTTIDRIAKHLPSTLIPPSRPKASKRYLERLFKLEPASRELARLDATRAAATTSR